MPIITVRNRALRWALIIGATLAVFLIIGVIADLTGTEPQP